MNAPAPPAAASPCPRCGEPLSALEHRGVKLDGCARCKGTLVPLPTLAPLLEATSVDLLANFDPDTRLDAVEKNVGGLACPRCSKGMDAGDYCGAGLVFFDRCERCNLLWVGATELGAMTLMWARMEKRAARLKAASDELDKELSILGQKGRLTAVQRVVVMALFSI